MGKVDPFWTAGGSGGVSQGSLGIFIKFRQFIEAERAHHPPEPCEPLGVGEEVTRGVQSLRHCAEFIDEKGLSLEAGPLLTKHHRATQI